MRELILGFAVGTGGAGLFFLVREIARHFWPYSPEQLERMLTMTRHREHLEVGSRYAIAGPRGKLGTGVYTGVRGALKAPLNEVLVFRLDDGTEREFAELAGLHFRRSRH